MTADVRACSACWRVREFGELLLVTPVDNRPEWTEPQQGRRNLGGNPSKFYLCRPSISPTCVARADSRARNRISLADPDAARAFDLARGGSRKHEGERAAIARAIHEAAPPRITWSMGQGATSASKTRLVRCYGRFTTPPGIG